MTFRQMRRPVFLALSLVAVFPHSVKLHAQSEGLNESAPVYSWNTVEAIEIHQKIRIETISLRGTWKGKLFGSNDQSITLQLPNGITKTFPKGDVRQIWIERKSAARYYAPLIGAAAGATVLAIIANRPRSDLSTRGKVLYTAAGAGVGGLIGVWVRAGRHDRLVYQRSPGTVP